jgi:rubrerythrin
MNTFEFALQMEKDGKEYYQKQALCINDGKAKKVFEMLADDENRHYRMIYKMLDEQQAAYQSTDTFKNVKNIFYDLKQANQCFKLEIDFLEVLLEAIKIENKSIELYQKVLNEDHPRKEKKLIEDILKEEEKHVVILDNMHAFLSKPKTWVESAEFNHLDEY